MFTLAVDICYISLTNSWYCVWLHKSANMHPLPRYSLKAGQRKWWELQVGFVLSIAESANTSRDPSQLELCCWLVVIPWTLPWGWLGGWRMCVCVCVWGGGGSSDTWLNFFNKDRIKVNPKYANVEVNITQRCGTWALRLVYTLCIMFTYHLHISTGHL